MFTASQVSSSDNRWNCKEACQSLIDIYLSMYKRTFIVADLELLMKDRNIYKLPSGEFDVEKYSLLATVGTSVTGLSSAAAGPLLDWIGPRATLGLSAIISTLGCLLFGFEISSLGGFVCMAVGGISCLLVGFRCGLLAPSRVSSAMSEQLQVSGREYNY